MLLENASGFLLQNAIVLLQIVTVITKCNVYYKMRQYSHSIFHTLKKKFKKFASC